MMLFGCENTFEYEYNIFDFKRIKVQFVCLHIANNMCADFFLLFLLFVCFSPETNAGVNGSQCNNL